MSDPRAEIHAALADERGARNRRVAALSLILLVCAAALPVLTGLRTIEPQLSLAALVAAAAVALGIAAAVLPRLRLAPSTRALLTAVGCLSPLLAATSLLATPPADFGAAGATCGFIVLGIGFGGLVATRTVLGRHRRRFGGAPQLLALAAAMVGALGVGLHCPVSSAAHLGHHVWGALAVLVLLAPWITPAE